MSDFLKWLSEPYQYENGRVLVAMVLVAVGGFVGGLAARRGR